ncbi:MAG TPA: SEC-C domain-containing protein [Candidatus Limnocylindrales bacterium]|nr:SEC-C domain-containing protein [Candidatus Limnocylindrales bacterium]
MARATVPAGRNELCPCGSGKKFKRCCGAPEVEKSDAAGSFFGIAAAITGVMIVIAVVAVARSFLEDPPQRVWSAEHGHWHTVSGASGSEDSGKPGPGKVWDEAHGHYHSTGGSAEGGPGKVWNEEHGHYHDAPGAAGVPEHSAPVANPLEERRRHMAETAREAAGTEKD